MNEQLKLLQKKAELRLRKWRIPLLLMTAGICLLMFGGKPAQPEQAASSEAFSLQNFQSRLEAQLAQIEGVGRTSLLLTLDQTGETVFAEEVRRTSSEGQEQSYESGLTLVSESGYGQMPVTVKQCMPTFRGAVVLCDGAADPAARLAVMEAVSTACGIGTNQVTVLKRAMSA